MLLVFRLKPFSPRFATPCHPKGNTDMRIMPMTNCAMCSKSFCHDGIRSKLAASAEWQHEKQNGNAEIRNISPCHSAPANGGVSNGPSRTKRKNAKNGVKAAFRPSEYTLVIVFFRQCSGRPVRRTYIYLAVGQPSARICRARRSARPNGRHGRCAKLYEKSFPRGGSPYVQDYRY